jgi:hypothetical protein
MVFFFFFFKCIICNKLSRWRTGRRHKVVREHPMEERTPAQDSLGTSDRGAIKLLGVDKDELERIVAVGLGHGGWAVSGRSAQEKTPQDPLD